MCKSTNSAIPNCFAKLIPNQNMMLKQEIKKSFLMVKKRPYGFLIAIKKTHE